MSERVTPDRIIDLGNAYQASAALRSALELDVFSQLATGPLDAETLRQRIGIHPRGARDFFDALVAVGLLRRTGEEYANTPEADLYLDRTKSSFLGPWLSGLRGFELFGKLTEGLCTGQAQRAPIQEAYATRYNDPTTALPFLQIMTSIHMVTHRAVAQKFPWAKYRTFVDVGCGIGGLAVQVALAHPHLTGGGFDLPAVQPFFEEYAASFELNNRLQFQAGSFFSDPLPQADVLTLGHILMDWDTEQRRSLIANAYKALSSGGALMVYETIIDDERRHNSRALLMSLHMLLDSVGGGEFTGADCCKSMREAGFRETSVEPLALGALGPESMVIGIK